MVRNPFRGKWIIAVLVGGLLCVHVQAQIVGGTNSQGHADVWWYVGGDSDEWISLVHDGVGNNPLAGASIVCSLCIYDGELYAGTDTGRVYRYLGGRSWQLTGDVDSGSEYPVAALAVCNEMLFAGLSDMEMTYVDGAYTYLGKDHLFRSGFKTYLF